MFFHDNLRFVRAFPVLTFDDTDARWFWRSKCTSPGYVGAREPHSEVRNLRNAQIKWWVNANVKHLDEDRTGRQDMNTSTSTWWWLWRDSMAAKRFSKRLLQPKHFFLTYWGGRLGFRLRIWTNSQVGAILLEIAHHVHQQDVKQALINPLTCSFFLCSFHVSNDHEE